MFNFDSYAEENRVSVSKKFKHASRAENSSSLLLEPSKIDTKRQHDTIKMG